MSLKVLGLKGTPFSVSLINYIIIFFFIYNYIPFTMSGQDDSDVYYNVRIINDINAVPLVEFAKRAEFLETRVIPILMNPNDYELAVVRFNVPTGSIPLFVWRDGQLEMSMTYNGTNVVGTLLHQGNGLDDLYGPAVYSYQELADSINEAITTTFNALAILEPAILGVVTAPPYMTFDSTTMLYSIFAELGWNDLVPGAPTVYVNSALGKLFQSSFQFFFNVPPVAESERYRARIKDNLDNTILIGGVPHLQMRQIFSTVSLINQFTNIVFQTARIPVAGEYLTGFERDINGQLIKGGANLTRNIITDFEPSGGIQDNTSIQFFPQGPLRYYPLKSNKELRVMDVSVWWEDSEQRLFPVYLQPADVLTIKLQFRKRREIVLRDHMEG